MPLVGGLALFALALLTDLAAGLAHRSRHYRLAWLGWLLCGLAMAGLVLGTLAPRPAAAAPQPSDSDWAKIVASAGFGPQLVTALEVLFAESDGNPDALNPSGARGAWQFMPNTLADDTCALDPVCSSKAAYDTYQHRSWSPWEAYTSGAYQRFSVRAHKAINDVAPGCDFWRDADCPIKLAWQGVVAGSTPITNLGLPSLPNPVEAIANLPAEVLGKIAAKMISYLARAADMALLKAFEGLWSAMLAGDDSLDGKESWGGAVVFDFTPVHKAWAISFGIAGGSLAVLLLTLAAVLLMLRAGAAEGQHEVLQLLVRVFAAFVLAAGSFFLINQAIALDNALVASVNSQVVLELRQLPLYQGLGLKDPDLASSSEDLINTLVLTLAALLICIEMGLVVILYSVRAIVLVALTVTAPFALIAAIVPQFRGVAIYWARLFAATVLIKFVNALIFGSFLLLGVAAKGIFNPILLGSLLLVMLLVPSTLHRATGEVPQLYNQAHGAVRTAVTYEPVRAVVRAGWGGLKTRAGWA